MVGAMRCAFLVVCGLLQACAAGPVPPLVEDGDVDLRTWNFDGGEVDLLGRWEFGAGRLLVEEGQPGSVLVDRLSVPGEWGRVPLSDGSSASGVGVGTLRVHLLLPPGPLALALSHAGCAYTLDAVDAAGVRTRLMSGGRVGVDAAHSAPDDLPQRVTLPNAGELTLLWQIANFALPNGGPVAVPRLGRPERLAQRRNSDAKREFYVIGMLAMFGVYHLALAALRRNEPAPLWFGLFCAGVALRTTTSGFHLQEALASVDHWSFVKRVDFLSGHIAQVCFVWYVRDLLPGLLSRAFVRTVTWPTFVLVILTLLTPPSVFGWTAVPFYVIIVASLLGLMSMMVAALRRRQNTTSISLMFVGIFFIVIASFNGVFVALHWVDARLLGPVGAAMTTGFILCLSLVIARSNASARRRAEDLSVRLQHFDQLKNEFLANTSHELRTPLNTIINVPAGLRNLIEARDVLICPGCAALFEDDNDDDDAAQVCGSCGHTGLVVERRRFAPDDAEALDLHLLNIIGSGQRLLSLVDDLLDYSRMAAGRLTIAPGPVALDDIVATALARSKPDADTAGLSLRSSVTPALVFVGDRQRLVQVVALLIGNAIKFSPQGGAVDVTGALDGSDVVVRIVDQGCGIAPADHALIFESFRQVEGGHTRKHGGAGLGLAIVRHIVELHGGRVWVESALGAGATFTVRLPPTPTARPEQPKRERIASVVI